MAAAGFQMTAAVFQMATAGNKMTAAKFQMTTAGNKMTAAEFQMSAAGNEMIAAELKTRGSENKMNAAGFVSAFRACGNANNRDETQKCAKLLPLVWRSSRGFAVICVYSFGVLRRFDFSFG